MRSCICASCAATSASSASEIWDDDDDQPKAADIQVGVLGLGVLGKDAASEARRRSASRSPAGARARRRCPASPASTGADGLEPLLARTDMLVVLLPLTDATRGIIDASLLAQARQGGRLGGPVLINAGRGGLQVEADILAALDSGLLKGASLDVFESEPLPVEFAPLDPPRRLRQPAQRRGLDAGSDRRLRRPRDRGPRTRRAAAPRRRSAARLLSPAPCCLIHSPTPRNPAIVGREGEKGRGRETCFGESIRFLTRTCFTPCGGWGTATRLRSSTPITQPLRPRFRLRPASRC